MSLPGLHHRVDRRAPRTPAAPPAGAGVKARRPQRAICPECERSVGVLDDGALVSHIAGTIYSRRCPGGEMPPTDGLIREVVDEVSAPDPIPADRTRSSVRAWRGGLPGLRL